MQKNPIKKPSNVFGGALFIARPPRNFNRGVWLTIDPGVHTAVAEWRNGVLIDIRYYTNAIEEFPKIHVASWYSVIIENVELWGGSAVSFASAAAGDTFRLAMQIGAMINTFNDATVANIFLVSPRIWKGQLNYEQLRHILKTRFKIQDIKNDHQASAIGIGLWAKGVF